MGIWAFGATVLATLFYRTLLSEMSLVAGLFLLIAVVAINILFDMIGTAATAAVEPPFHAMAADRVFGAKTAVRLVRHADRVANIANDLVGDVAGTLGGALAASIVFMIAINAGSKTEAVIEMFVVASVAAVTVAGKAISKWYSVTRANEIIFATGRFLARIESWTGHSFFDNGNAKRGRDREQRERERERERNRAGKER